MSTTGDAVTRTKEDFKVDLFRGDRTKLRAYLIQLKLVFKLHSAKYPEGSTQVLFAATYLRDAAFSWFEPYMSDYLDEEDDNEDDTDTMFESFSNFEAKLKQVFGVVDEERAAERQIRQLRQKGSAATYYSEFLQLASRLDWDDSAKASAYYMGLSDAVKDQMIPTPPTELQELIDKSIKIDNRLYERRMEKTGYYDRPRQNNHGGWNKNQQKDWKKVNYRDYGDPMDLSEMNRGPPAGRGRPRSRRGGRQERGPGRDEQRKNNLCFNCNKPGHRAAECAGAAQKLHMMNEEPGIVAKKADTTIETRNDQAVAGTAQKEPELVQEPKPKEWEPDTPKTRERLGEKFEAPPMRRQGHSCSPWTECRCEGPTCIGHICDGGGSGRDPPPPGVGSLQHASLSWTACYEDYCPIHRSDKEGSGWFPTKPKRKRKNFRNKISNKTSCGDQESLSMMNDEIPETELPEQEIGEDPIKFYVIGFTDEYARILTRWWKREICITCNDGILHSHFIFDPDVKPKIWQHCITLYFCQDRDCQYAEKTHCHQGNDDRQLEMEVPEEIRQQGWNQPSAQDLSMMTEGSPLEDQKEEVIKTIIIWDEKGDEELWSRDFECEDTECPEYYMSNHEHRFNVDPRYPDYKILPEAIDRMKAQGRVCDTHGCAWQEYYHVHFTDRDIHESRHLPEKE
jgi:hypothetical protein